jgi:predicted DNA-binding protein
MANAVKMTFTLDQATADRIDRTAKRLGIPKSGVIREAVAEYAARAGGLSESERLSMLDVLDRLVARKPTRTAAAVDREIESVRRARREGGRRVSSRSAT